MSQIEADTGALENLYGVISECIEEVDGRVNQLYPAFRELKSHWRDQKAETFAVMFEDLMGNLVRFGVDMQEQKDKLFKIILALHRYEEIG